MCEGTVFRNMTRPAKRWSTISWLRRPLHLLIPNYSVEQRLAFRMRVTTTMMSSRAQESAASIGRIDADHVDASQAQVADEKRAGIADRSGDLTDQPGVPLSSSSDRHRWDRTDDR